MATTLVIETEDDISITISDQRNEGLGYSHRLQLQDMRNRKIVLAVYLTKEEVVKIRETFFNT